MPAIYKDGKWYIGDNSGHMIKDNGTDLYPREALNFTDFNVQDDSVNDETDIKPHRLTQEELSEIMSKKPSPKESYPILFDETGAEHVVGWYKYVDGTKQPIYQKTINIGSVTNGNYMISFSSLKAIIDVCGNFRFPLEWGGDYGTIPYVYENTSVSVSYSVSNSRISFNNKIGQTLTDVHLTIRYTKTTDQPQ